MLGFIARKRRQVTILKRKLDQAKEALNMANSSISIPMENEEK